MTEHVVLVDENDQAYGVEEKMQAHKDGKLHRAFSVFILSEENGQYYTLLQQRHITKYHCGGLWSNTCCSHPRQNESIEAAGERRLVEEMGINLPLRAVDSFTYKAEFNNGLIEHEFDHVLVGVMSRDEQFNVNSYEVMDSKWVLLDEDLFKAADNHEKFTPWFKQALSLVKNYLQQNQVKSQVKEKAMADA